MAENLKLTVSSSQLNKGLAKATTADKVKFYYELMKEHGYLDVDTRYPKNNCQSKAFRKAGNELFVKGSKCMYEAMRMYNKAICFAVPGNGDELSVAIANRSAVLFSWKEYNLCRENITLAKAMRCPQRLMKKLDDRDIKCVTAMKNEVKAKKNASVHVTQPILTMHRSIEPMYSYDEYHGEPSLSLTPNSKMPFAVESLEIKYDSLHGRHITTKEVLKPGQIVVIENPFVHAPCMLDDLYRYTKCANCYEENCLSLMPCSTCTNTMYCSEKCLVDSKQFHDIECGISDFMLAYGSFDLLAVRLTLQAYTSFESTTALNEFCKSHKDSEDQASQLSFDEDLSLEQKYRQIYGYARRKSTTIDEYCKAAFFYQILTEHTKFIDMLNTDDDHHTLMGLIKRHIEIANWNGIGSMEYRTFDMSDAGGDKSVDIHSQGIYRFTDLFRHSCAPNIAVIAKGSKIIVYCCRMIKAGSQLLRSYKGYVSLNKL